MAWSYREALETGTWSVSDAALVDDLVARLGTVQRADREDVGFYDIEELDELSQWGVIDVRAGVDRRVPVEETQSEITPADARERLMMGRIDRPSGYAHVLVDEAQDLSPMQWRMLARRGRAASWTVVGDAAQASWGDLAEAGRGARRGVQRAGAPRVPHGHQLPQRPRDLRLRARRHPAAWCPTPTSRMPCARPGSTRSTASWRVRSRRPRPTPSTSCSARSRGRSPSSPARAGWQRLAGLDGAGAGRVQLIDPLSTKGLEWDATVVVDPEGIVAESPGGVRVLYVVLTRAAHRMHVAAPV